MAKVDKSGGHSFADSHDGAGEVFLLDLGGWEGCVDDNREVVTQKGAAGLHG